MKHLMYKGSIVPYPSPDKAGKAESVRGTPCHSYAAQCIGAKGSNECGKCLFSTISNREYKLEEKYAMWKRGKSKSRKVWEGMF